MDLGPLLAPVLGGIWGRDPAEVRVVDGGGSSEASEWSSCGSREGASGSKPSCSWQQSLPVVGHGCRAPSWWALQKELGQSWQKASEFLPHTSQWCQGQSQRPKQKHEVVQIKHCGIHTQLIQFNSIIHIYCAIYNQIVLSLYYTKERALLLLHSTDI